MALDEDDFTPEQRRALRSPKARALFACVKATPGLCTAELQRAVGVGSGTVRHHLSALLDAELVKVERKGRRKCYFSSSVSLEDLSPRLRLALRGPSRRDVAAAIAAEGEVTVAEIIGTTHLSRRSAYYHVNHLIAAGLAERCGRLIVAKPPLTVALRETV